MPVPTLISQLSTTASRNSPDGAVDVPSSIDDYQRAHAAFIAQLYAGTVAAPTVIVPSATTTDIGAAASENVDISGNTTITGFGTVAEGINRKGRFTGVLTLTHNATSLILPGNANITTAANDRYEARSLGGGNWIVTKYQYASGLVQSVDIQNQTVTAFTTAGAAPNFTLTPVPAPAALTANLRFRVKFHAAGAGSDVLNIGALGNKSLKQFDLSGAKVAANIRANQLADIEYDGTDLIILDPLPAGLGSFLVSTGATTTLTFQDVGKSFIGASGTAFTLTLPLASACPTGSRISFANFNSGVMTVARQGTDNINNGGSNTSIVLGIGGILEVECSSSGQWYVTKMSGLGVDQTWTDVTGSRAFATTYTNTTGKPIAVTVTTLNTVASSTESVQISVNGQVVMQQNNIAAATIGSTAMVVFAIVPPGATYNVTVTQASLNAWKELRI